DAGAPEDLVQHHDGEIVRPDLTEDAPLGVRPPEGRADVTDENDVTKLGHDGRACTVRRALLANPVDADGAVGPAGREVRQRAVRAHGARLRGRAHHVAAVRRAQVVAAEGRDSRAAGTLHADVPRRATIRCRWTRRAVRDVGLHAALVAHARRGRAGVGVGAVRRRTADADAADAGDVVLALLGTVALVAVAALQV